MVLLLINFLIKAIFNKYEIYISKIKIFCVQKQTGFTQIYTYKKAFEYTLSMQKVWSPF